MYDILINSFSFLFAILLGYALKQVGLFKQSDGEVLSKIFVYITLPATVITGLNGMSVNMVALGLVALGLLSNVILAFVGYFGGRGASVANRGAMMLTVSSFNIGGFTIPFVHLLIPTAVAYVGMFDIGNAFMLSGGTLVLASILLKKDEGVMSLSGIFKKLMTSPVFVVYLAMFILSLFSITLPEFVLPPMRLLASANSFVAMFTIGLFLRIKLHKEGWKLVGKLLFLRYATLLIFAVLAYFLMPLDLFMRQVLVLAVLSPIGNLALIQATEFGGDEGTYGLAGSLAIIISLIFMSIAMLIMA